MRLLRFGEVGSERPGLLDAENNIRDLSSIVTDFTPDVIGDLATLGSLDVSRLPPVESPRRLGPCVPRPGKFLCIGLNYADHAAEAGMPIPAEPIVFAKAANSVAGPNDDIVIPRGSSCTDWEVELGVVVGKRLSYADEAAAAAAIAGYCVVNDLSEREWQLERGGQWIKGKSADGFGPIGPYLVTPDEIADADALHMWLDVDGERMQDGNTATMIFKPAYILSYLSQFMTLEPGDLISTGTPPGVGMGQKPARYLESGQVIELGIAGLGVQRQRTVEWSQTAEPL